VHRLTADINAGTKIAGHALVGRPPSSSRHPT
jgi:hypothetical protein